MPHKESVERQIKYTSYEERALLLQRFWVFLIAGWSGFVVMAVEILSGRILAPYFGNSIHVWGAVITMFMVALAVGYLLGGRYSIYQPNLLRLTLLLMAAAISLLPVIFMAERVLDWIFMHISDARYGSLLAVTALFFIPTLLSGMVSPYAVRLLVINSERSGHDAGKLYFISTFGSAAGTLLTSFYLVLYWEINQIIGGLMVISLIFGLIVQLSIKLQHEIIQHH